MERLTNKNGDGFIACNGCEKPHCTECGEFLKQAQRLAAYEDTGLTPEAVERVNTFVGSELEKMLVKNAKLEHDLESANGTIAALLADLSGSCFACACAKPYKAEQLPESIMMTCEHMNEMGFVATSRRWNCPHFQWRGPREEA